jgi:predicted extracellular nuclease
MRALTTLLFGALMVTCLASTATAQRWKYPPGPPYRPTCTDTLKVFDLQQADTTLAPCHPATLDTVWGVNGIVTGMDQKASAYGFWIQNSFSDGAHAWTGIDIFTGGTNYGPLGISVGDSVVVYGTTQEFNGLTELEGPDTFQSTNDIIIRKIAGPTHALPNFHVASTTQLNWVPLISAATAEPWEGCLVRINGPLKVARVQTGAGVAGNTFLIVNPGVPGDSVLVDGFSLTTYGTPPLNTSIDFVQGILNQANSTAGTGAVNSYRIQIRDGSDISVASPPNLNDAYAIQDNQLRLVFDRNLDPTTAQTAGNYSLGSGLSGSTVNSATLETNPGTVVLLGITSVLVHGDIETVTAAGVGSATCPTCLSASQTQTFVNGVLTIQEIEQPNVAMLPLFDDRSRFSGAGTAPGTRMSFRGVATGAYGTLYFMQDLGGGNRSGVSVFGPSTPLSPGRKYLVVGQVQEFGLETEVVNSAYIVDEGVGAVPGPVLQPVAVLADTSTDMTQTLNTGEDWECVLVRIENAKVVNFNTAPTDPTAGGSFRVVAPAPTYPDTILISDIGSKYVYDATAGDIVNVNGVLHITNGSYRILPGSDADIEHVFLVDVGPHGSSELSLSVSPNPARDARIKFSLPNQASVDLGVFDLAGRLVKEIAKGSFAPGTYSRTWNGTDASGGRVRAGMYFYRLKAGGKVLQTRGVILN